MPNSTYHSLDDFLATHPLTVDGVADDGGGGIYRLKGIEINATILFCDISNFSGRTFHMTPTETLAFVNHFFTWIAEALHGRPGIVDKYIGDEIMVVYSEAFGSNDPFHDAVLTAKDMIDYDPWAFEPHVGIATGPVTVGYVGTPIKYNCSVFGQCVATAARCAGIKPTGDGPYGGFVTFPETAWGERQLDSIAPPRGYKPPDGTTHTDAINLWELTPTRAVPIKNMGDLNVRQLIKRSSWHPTTNPEDRAKTILTNLQNQGRYRPIKTPSQTDTR